MNTDLLKATFAEHESDAPDVDETRALIDGRINRPSRRRPIIVAVACTLVIVAAAAAFPTLLASRSGKSHSVDVGAHHSTTPTPRPSSAVVTHPKPSSFAGTSRPAQSPAPGTIFDFPWKPSAFPEPFHNDGCEISVEANQYYVCGWSTNRVRYGPDNRVADLTIASDHVEFDKQFRDGGTVESLTIAGRPAYAAWSGLVYALKVSRPGGMVVEVFVGGFGRKICSQYAIAIAEKLQYGAFPTPVR